MSEKEFAPLVSVVIPTFARPKTVARAIKSVLGQTYKRLEVIVVLDGPDPETLACLIMFDDPRLEIHQNAGNLGAARSRNVGVAAAVGDYVAFLDDDDEWWPTKIERQVAYLADRPDDLITCLTLVSTGTDSTIRPRQAYDGSVPLDVWLFGGNGLFAGSSFLQTSSLILRREIVTRCPFPSGSPHDDWEFAIRLANQIGVSVSTVPEVLVTVHVAETGKSLSSVDHWRTSLQWVTGMRHLMAPRSVAGFCLGVVGSRAADAGQRSAMPMILYHALCLGRPGFLKVLAFFGFALITATTRRKLLAVIKHSPTGQTTVLQKMAQR